MDKQRWHHRGGLCCPHKTRNCHIPDNVWQFECLLFLWGLRDRQASILGNRAVHRYILSHHPLTCHACERPLSPVDHHHTYCLLPQNRFLIKQLCCNTSVKCHSQHIVAATAICIIPLSYCRIVLLSARSAIGAKGRKGMS